MTQHIDIYDTNGTVTLPSDLVSTNLAVTAIGAGYESSTIGAYVSGTVPASLFPLTLVIGEKPTGSPFNGGDGYSGGGAGDGNQGGGGSTGVLSGSTLIIEAGGQDGVTTIPGTTPPGGSGGGFASNTPPGGAGGVGDGAGSGGSQGGNGGNSGTDTGGTGVGGGTNGNSNSGTSSGAGVGSGGLTVPGYAASFAASSVVAAQYGPGPVSGIDTGTGYVAVTYDVADAPVAPLLVNPPASSFVDTNADGVTFVGTYQTMGADTGALLGVALRLKIDGGTVHYWNGTDFTSTSPVYVTPDTGIGVTNGENFSVTIPAGLLADGHTYTWSFSCQEGFASLTGPFATNISFTGAMAPSAVVTSPASTVATLTPNVTWTPTTPAGSQTDYRYVIYTEPQDDPGSGAPVLDSGVVASSGHNFAIPGSTLHSVDTYYGYLQITETGGQLSAWVPFVFTVQLVDPAVPTLSGAISNEPVSGCPAPFLQANDNSGPLAPATCQADLLPTFPVVIISSGVGQNNLFIVTYEATGISEMFAIPAGTYSTMTTLLAAIGNAVGSLAGELFSTKYTPSPPP